MAKDAANPTVIHLGKKSRKQIKQYKKGFGNMFMEVQHLVTNLKAKAGPNTDIVPTVVVHQKKRKKGLFS